MDDYSILAKSDAIYLDTSALAKIQKEEGDSSRLIRLLVYFSTIPIFTSLVGFGEFVHIVTGKREQKDMGGVIGYLYHCRQLMVDLDMKKIRRVEPVSERFHFFELAGQLSSRYPKIGGGDIWHLLAVLELKLKYPLATLLTYDEDQMKSAKSEKIQVVHGNNLLSNTLAEELKAVNKSIMM